MPEIEGHEKAALFEGYETLTAGGAHDGDFGIGLARGGELPGGG